MKTLSCALLRSCIKPTSGLAQNLKALYNEPGAGPGWVGLFGLGWDRIRCFRSTWPTPSCRDARCATTAHARTSLGVAGRHFNMQCTRAHTCAALGARHLQHIPLLSRKPAPAVVQRQRARARAHTHTHNHLYLGHSPMQEPTARPITHPVARAYPWRLCGTCATPAQDLLPGGGSKAAKVKTHPQQALPMALTCFRWP
jgi:hypothetical protein